MKKAIVVGATSGIGRELAVLLARQNYKVGITGRRTELLSALKTVSDDSFIIAGFDVTDVANVPLHLKQLTAGLGGLDLLILASGTGEINPALDTAVEQQTNAVNVTGFTAVTNWAFNYFEKQGAGHLAVITSVAAIRGSAQAPAYGASKAYQVNYLEGLRQKAHKLNLPVYVTDIRPGFVDTPMAKAENKFWVAPVEKAAAQIFKAIQNKRDVVYITKRWRVVAFVLRLIPGLLYKRL